MHVILVGFGQIGTRFVDMLLVGHNRVTVVDTNAERAALARERFGERGVTSIAGDATTESVLREAGADRADALVATTRSDPVNLMVASLARRLGTGHSISLVNEPEAEPLFKEEAVATVGNASRVTAEYLYQAFELPGIRTFMPLGEEGKVVTTVIHPKSDLAGRSLLEAGLGRDVLVAAIRRGERVILPRGSTLLQAGDVLTVVARIGFIESFMTRVTSATGLDVLLKGRRGGFHLRRR